MTDNPILTARERAGLSRLEVAREVSISLLVLTRLESGAVVRVTEQQYQSLVRLLGLAGREINYLRPMVMYEVQVSTVPKRKNTGRTACKDCNKPIPSAYFDPKEPYCASCRMIRGAIRNQLAGRVDSRIRVQERPPRRTRFRE